MDIKYYDLLSSTIIGASVVAVVNTLFYENVNVDAVVYLALGYLVGYFLNAVGCLLERFYFKKMKGGIPSDNLLTLVEGQNWTGYKRVKFYQAEKAIELLKNELNKQDASKEEMFEYAMRKVNGCENSRVPTFNAQYAFSRTFLTTVLIMIVLIGIGLIDYLRIEDVWVILLIALITMVVSWIRFKERGYYYAREVLNEYINQSVGVSNRISEQ